MHHIYTHSTHNFKIHNAMIMPCFSYFLYFTCGRFSADVPGKVLCQRGKIKIPSIIHPWQEASQGCRGNLRRDFEGRGGKKKWLNTISEIDDDFKLINFVPTFPFWCLIDISNLSPNENTWFPPPLSKPALTHLIKSYHWSPSFLCLKHRSHPRFLSL